MYGLLMTSVINGRNLSFICLMPLKDLLTREINPRSPTNCV